MARRLLDPQRSGSWHDDGWCLLDGIFSAEEIVAAQEGVGTLFPSAEDVASRRVASGDNFDISWDAIKPSFPFASQALNHLALHDGIIDLAEELLGTTQLRMYQGIVSAKYSEGTDYEQLLHADYCNHTLVVPRADVGYQQLELFIYLSDVAPETAATLMVSRRLTTGIPVERAYLNPAEYGELYDAAIPASGPAGSVLAYRPDTYHRGTSLSAPGAARFLLHVAYKPVATDWLGYQAWPAKAEDGDWHRFVQHTTLRQLTVLGFPEPGDPYWTRETLDGVAARYPLLDMTPWRQGFRGEATT